MDTFSITASIEKAKKTKRNVFMIGETLTMDHFQIFMNVIKSNHFSRVRFCFISCTITQSAIDMINKLVEEGSTIDALLFYNVSFLGFNAVFDFISKLTDLTVLSFSNSNLKSCDVKKFTEMLKCLDYIVTFSVSDERCNTLFFDEVCLALTNKLYLANFQWKNSNLGDSDIFAAFFNSAPSLKNVDISNASLNEGWRDTLNMLLDNSWKLEDLSVSDYNDKLNMKIKRNKERARQSKMMPSFGLLNMIHEI